MLKSKYSTTMIIAAALLAMFSVANCNSSQSVFVRQARFSPERGLTCSRRSPRNGDAILSGATVSTNCLGVTNTTTTDSAGRFTMITNFAVPMQVRNIRRNCDFVITLPPNCTIAGTTILVNDDNPEFRFLDNTVVGGSAVFEIEDFERP